MRVAREHSEVALAELIELAPGGVEEVEIDAETIEYAVYGAPGELPALPDLDAAVGEALVEIRTTEVPDDLSERWRQFHRPILIEGAPYDLYIRPPWEAGTREKGVREIVIDPGQAFGTGAHATTRLCLELLLELAGREEGRGPVIDVGTGSGVLAIAAALIGFAPVLGLDHEHESVQAASENARVNRATIEVRHFDLRRERLPLTQWPEHPDPPVGVPRTVILANLLSGLLVDLSRTVVAAPAHLIASGLLIDQVDEVVEAFAERLGMREQQRRRRGEWAAVWMSSG